MYTETDLAWLAGLFDGEGSISVYKAKHGWQFRFSINNTDSAIIEKATRLCEEIGGVPVYRRVKSKGQERKNPCGEIILRDRKAILKIFEAIEPYLVGKKLIARIYIEGIKLREADSHYHKRSTQWVMEELYNLNPTRRNRRYALYEEGEKTLP